MLCTLPMSSGMNPNACRSAGVVRSRGVKPGASGSGKAGWCGRWAYNLSGKIALSPEREDRLVLWISDPKPIDGFATRLRTCLSNPTKAPQKTKRMLVVSMVYWSTLPEGGDACEGDDDPDGP